MDRSIIITCEHAGNHIPESYLPYFKNADQVLQSHEGWDPGTWPLANLLAKAFDAPLFGCQTSRLLIEVNRSLHHPQLFSRYTSQLNDKEKQEVINSFYLPYRTQVENEISASPKPVLHLSIHSFTPIWNGIARDVDIGLLFDPDRKLELSFCQHYEMALNKVPPPYRLQFNKPYLGIDDGLTTYLRTKFKDKDYAGIEIEINQKLISNQEEISQKLISGLKKVALN